MEEDCSICTISIRLLLLCHVQSDFWHMYFASKLRVPSDDF